MSHKSFRPLASLILALAIAFAGVSPALAAPPLNDFFVDAEPIPSLNFSATVDITEATIEDNEPQICWFMTNTVWYSFTPSKNMTARASTAGSAIGANVNVYRAVGSGINNLSFMGCASFGNTVNLILEGGTTYYLQAGPTFGEAGNVQVNLEQFTPPPPQVNFFYFPSDASIYDTITFCDQSFDPGEFGFNDFSWDFGDGATSTVNCASHQYAADGDYTVQHSATTVDGRTGSTSQVVQVRTHDVSIVRVSAPRSATVGQTRAISVSVRNTRYAETVRLDLYKSVAGGGFEFVGSSTQFVPVRSGNRTSDFVLNYTFTPADAQIGKVVFRVFVILVSARDAFPADNEGFSSPPTVVKK